MSIYFYRYTKPNGEFSNFFPCDFEENGIKFNCNEQYFIFNKVLEFDPSNSVLIDKIMNETRPSFIRRYGGRKHLKKFNNKIWIEKRFDIMLKGLRLKFLQNECLRKKLLSTGDKMLYEAAFRDKVWGIGYGYRQALNTPIEKYGQNLLGKALMIVRLELQQNMIK